MITLTMIMPMMQRQTGGTIKMVTRVTRKLFPHPLLSLLLVIVWCLLSNYISLGTVVFGTILGIIIPIITAPFWSSMSNT